MLLLPQMVGFKHGVNPLSASFIASASSSNSDRLTAMGSIQAGDLLLYIDLAAEALSIPIDVVPTEFTGVYTNTATLGGGSTGYRVRISRKIAAGSESGNIIGMVGGWSAAKVLLQFRGNRVFASVSFSTPTWEATDVNPAQQTIAMSGQNTPIIGLGIFNGGFGIAVDPRTMSASDGEINPDTSFYVKYKIYNASPADVTFDMDDEGGDNILSGVYAIPAE